MVDTETGRLWQLYHNAESVDQRFAALFTWTEAPGCLKQARFVVRTGRDVTEFRNRTYSMLERRPVKDAEL